MATINWESLPQGLWTHPAEQADIGDYRVLAYTEHGIPTWEVERNIGKVDGRPKWINMAMGTADSFDSAKAAAIFEMERVR